MRLRRVRQALLCFEALHAMRPTLPREVWRFTGVPVAALSTCLAAILSGSWLMESYDRISSRLQGLGYLLMHGAGLALALAVLLLIALAASLLLMIVRPALRSRRLTVTCVFGCGVLLWAWTAGVRLPQVHTGEFTGRYVLHPLCCRSDIFIPTGNLVHRLRRGAALGQPQEWRTEVPIIAAVSRPRRGWRGGAPESWPATYSDSHGAQSFCVRVRGRLTGPGQYGWPPVLQYRLRVDSVVRTAARLPGEDRDCTAPLD